VESRILRPFQRWAAPDAPWPATTYTRVRLVWQLRFTSATNRFSARGFRMKCTAASRAYFAIASIKTGRLRRRYRNSQTRSDIRTAVKLRAPRLCRSACAAVVIASRPLRCAKAA
jgi:hypothetical protein